MVETVDTGNTILPAPRLTGDPQQDTLIQQRWMSDLYNALVRNGNVLGTLADHEKRITALENP